MTIAETKKTWGLLAEYKKPHDILIACMKVRDAGYKNWDACTPFPVHGLDKAMGLKPSFIAWMVLVAGITGGSLALFFTVWVSAFDYPLNIGGKPTWSIPAFVPVIFEVTILFSALTAVFGMFFINGLPTFHHPLFQSKRFEKVTDDSFFVVIESSDRVFDHAKTEALLLSTNPENVEVLEV